MKIPLHRRLQSAVFLAVFFCQGLVPLLPAQSSGVPQLMNYQGRVTMAGTNFHGTGYFKFSLVDGGSDQNRPAAATATITPSGRVSSVTLTDGGRGYVVKPNLSFVGTGTGASATATITGGEVTAVTVDSAGSGFSTITPTLVSFTAPPPDVQTTTLWSNDGVGQLGLEPETALPLAVQKGLYSVLLGDDALMTPLPPAIFANRDVRLRVWFSAEENGPFTQLMPDQRIAAVGYALMAHDVRDGAITSSKLAADAITMAQLSPELRQAILSLQAWQSTQLPLITSPASAAAAVDQVFTYQIIASGSPTAYAATGLPAGWTLQTATGLITATPAVEGTVNLSVTATNVAGTGPPLNVVITVAGPVFVDYTTGNDGAAGTQAAPVKSIAQGLAIAASGPAVRNVNVSDALQPLYTPLALRGGVAARGGYDRAAGWTRTAPRTPIHYVPPDVADAEAAVVAKNITAPALLDGFAITSDAGPGAGRSTIGVRLRNCQHMVTLSNNTLTVGNGVNGLAGGSVLPGNDGADGWDAVSWRGPFFPANGGPSDGSQAQRFGNGGIPAPPFNIPFAYFGVPILAGTGYPGRDGSGLIQADPNGIGGWAEFPNGVNGSNGTYGANGGTGSHGTATPGIQLAGNFSSTEGGTGTAGGNGGNGGGGGGGGAVGHTYTTNTDYYGGGGGGGGMGGTGGAGGKGGKGAGGSFAVMVVNSSVTVTGCMLTTGNGGAGGNGGNGHTGGAGGNGGTGFVTPASGGINSGNGGHGGDGGNGGNGGGGAGGQGGPSIGIITSAASTLNESGNTFTLGTAGAGGMGGLRGGSTTNRAPSGSAGLRQNVLTGVQP